MAETLTALFDDLQAERERTWPAEKLRLNAAQRQALVAAFDPETVVREGDRVPDAAIEAPGGLVTIGELVANGPVLLVFFRFAGCPACNIALPFYDRALAPVLRPRGIRIAALTPHLQARGADAIRARHDLSFPVFTDRDNRLARALGIAFQPEEPPPVPEGDDWIGALTGTGTWELPQPALVLIDPDRTVRFADVSPDWLCRTEPAALLESVETSAA